MIDTHSGFVETHSGFVAIIGRPNVGKSTLLNQILGEQLSITSRKPQTTRHRILGIKTIHNTQIIFVDTPGIHAQNQKKLNQVMNKTARQALRDVDVVLFVTEALKWNVEDAAIIEFFSHLTCPVIALINKVDLISDKDRLLPYIENLTKQYSFLDIIPISAKTGIHIEKLENILIENMPLGPFYYPIEQKTDKTIRFRVAEAIRKELMDALGQELPYAVTVSIESFKTEGPVTHIQAIIWVEREGQKAIVIGKGGETLKKIGTRARKSILSFMTTKVHLVLWVKVKKGWSDDEKALKSLGYLDLD